MRGVAMSNVVSLFPNKPVVPVLAVSRFCVKINFTVGSMHTQQSVVCDSLHELFGEAFTSIGLWVERNVRVGRLCIILKAKNGRILFSDDFFYNHTTIMPFLATDLARIRSDVTTGIICNEYIINVHYISNVEVINLMQYRTKIGSRK